MKIQDIIFISPDVQFGTPVFRGTRVPVEFLFDFLEDGLSIDQFLEEFPTVRHEQVIQLLEMTNKLHKSPKIFDIYESVA